MTIAASTAVTLRLVKPTALAVIKIVRRKKMIYRDRIDAGKQLATKLDDFLHGKSSRELKVGEIMSANVYFVRPEQTIEECMALLTNKRVRHLPVLQHDELLGIISIGDVVKAVIAEQESTIKHLEHYITGGR